jgi:hypothetical protein
VGKSGKLLFVGFLNQRQTDGDCKIIASLGARTSMSAGVRSKLFGFQRRQDASYPDGGYAMQAHADADVRAPSIIPGLVNDFFKNHKFIEHQLPLSSHQFEPLP